MIHMLYSVSQGRKQDGKAVTVLLNTCNWVTLLLFKVQMHAWQAKLLPGVVLFASRDKLGQEYLRTVSKYSNSACIMLHLLISAFSVFISSFSSFFFRLSSSYTELLSVLLWYKYPSLPISFRKSRTERSNDATASSPPQGNSNN